MIVPVLIGVALRALGAAAWTGRRRRWAARDGPPAYSGPITVVPGLGLFTICAGLAYEEIGRRSRTPSAASGSSAACCSI